MLPSTQSTPAKSDSTEIDDIEEQTSIITLGAEFSMYGNKDIEKNNVKPTLSKLIQAKDAKLAP